MSQSALNAIRDGLREAIDAEGPITNESLALATSKVMGQLQTSLTLDVLLDDATLDFIEHACNSASEAPWGFTGYVPPEDDEVFEEDHVDLPWCAVVPVVKEHPDERPEGDTFHEADLGLVLSGEPIAIFPPREIDEFLVNMSGEDPFEDLEVMGQLSNFSNAKFISVARAAVPHLVREIKQLRALLQPVD